MRAWAGMACSAPLSTRVTDTALTLEAPEPLSEPSVRTSTVRTDEDGITLWVRFKDVEGPHTVRVRWFDPLGRLALDSGPLVLNSEGGYRRIAGLTAHMPIRNAPSAQLPGAWRAEVSLDGNPLTEARFELEDTG